MFDVRNFNLICVLQNPVRADFQPLIMDTQITAYRANDKAFVEPTVGSEVIDNVIRPLSGHTSFVEIED